MKYILKFIENNLNMILVCVLYLSLEFSVKTLSVIAQSSDTLNFTAYGNWIPLFVGWLVGFVPPAAVAGVEQCIPSLVYSLESAILIGYDQTQYQNYNLNGYTLDLYANIFRLVLELYGSWAYCSTSLFRVLGTTHK